MRATVRFWMGVWAVVGLSVLSMGQEAWAKESSPHPILFDTRGNAVDAHDGKLYKFGDTFYLYGTSYACGFRWLDEKSPFCGFKSYSSKDLVHWNDEGFLYDARTPFWQFNCSGRGSGCFRPHVLYNKRTGRYVLWINGYGPRISLHVFESASPTGPFEELKSEPSIGSDRDQVYAGDFDLFEDTDGHAYIALTDWRLGGDIVVEELNSDFTSGTGRYARIGTKKVEAPALFRHGDRYYMTLSDPNCGYCTTGTSYLTAPSPLGPWTRELRKITSTSCGGQPASVTEIEGARGPVLVYMSDLWHSTPKMGWNQPDMNQALAVPFFSALEFGRGGAIAPIDCAKPLDPRALGVAATASKPVFRPFCDIGPHRRTQGFRAPNTGTLSTLSFTAYQKGQPQGPLLVEILDGSGPVGRVLYSKLIAPTSVSWAPDAITVSPELKVVAGKTYSLRLSSPDSKRGCYGVALADGELSESWISVKHLPLWKRSKAIRVDAKIQ